jgi:hypothetical protein
LRMTDFIPRDLSPEECQRAWNQLEPRPDICLEFGLNSSDGLNFINDEELEQFSIHLSAVRKGRFRAIVWRLENARPGVNYEEAFQEIQTRVSDTPPFAEAVAALQLEGPDDIAFLSKEDVDMLVEHLGTLRKRKMKRKLGYGGDV